MNVPGSDHEVYFFRGTKYVKIHLQDDRITSGPASLADKWPGLTKACFDSIDTIMMVPDSTDDAYFFRGNKIVMIQLYPDPRTWKLHGMGRLSGFQRNTFGSG